MLGVNQAIPIAGLGHSALLYALRSWPLYSNRATQIGWAREPELALTFLLSLYL